MYGQETDFKRLQADLMAVLHLPTKQIETVMTALTNGHGIAIGNEEPDESDPPAFLTALFAEHKDEDAVRPSDPTSLALPPGLTRELLEEGLPRLPVEWPSVGFSIGEPLKSIQPLRFPMRSLKPFSYAALESFGMRVVTP